MGRICRTIWKQRTEVAFNARTANGNEQLKAGGCRTIYINGSFFTIKPNPGDFDACWDREDVDINYLKSQVTQLLNYDDRAGQ